MERNDVFWMVKGAGPTSAIHDSKTSAKCEAIRLARANPGERFYVLVAETAYQVADVAEIDLQIPF